jgi:thiamine pyrophosphokinase
MKRAFVFANGSMDEPPAILQDIQPADLILTADGGTHHCQKLGIQPNVIIGDFDSLEPAAIESYMQSGTRLIRYPAHKDETDLELVLNYALEQKVDEVYIIGAMGKRWDMTFANTLLASHPRYADFSIHLVDGAQELTFLKSGGKIKINNKAGGALSLIPLAGNAIGVATHGLEYPLSSETLYFGSPRGVSNLILEDIAWVSLEKGILLVCLAYPAEF